AWLSAAAGVLVSVVCGDCLFFFFQAEDGIRDWSVTGVQTCALPISRHRHRAGGPRRRLLWRERHGEAPRVQPGGAEPAIALRRRSEERRVGKECRARWSPED